MQSLQWIATGKYDAKPSVDQYLQKAESETALPDGLRFTGARTARAIYTMRNKRNIAHIGEVDPNAIDLAFTAHGSAWIMSELVRVATGISMDEAGKIIELLQMPVDDMVEDIGDVRLIHGDFQVREELLVLLRSFYPEFVPTLRILKSLERWSEGSVKNKLRDLVETKEAFGDMKSGFRLTKVGYQAALEVIRQAATPRTE